MSPESVSGMKATFDNGSDMKNIKLDTLLMSSPDGKGPILVKAPVKVATAQANKPKLVSISKKQSP